MLVPRAGVKYGLNRVIHRVNTARRAKCLLWRHEELSMALNGTAEAASAARVASPMRGSVNG